MKWSQQLNDNRSSNQSTPIGKDRTISHFFVLVRIPANVSVADLESHVGKMMMSYQKTSGGENCPPELKERLTFTDEEEEYRKRYDTETSDMVRLATGEELSKYDNRLRNPELFNGPQFLIPADAVEFEVPHRERFATFEQFMADYCGYAARDPKMNRYGHWSNPNAKWDYWTIGGRWTGKLSFNYDLAKDPDNYKRCWLCSGSGTRRDTAYPAGDDSPYRQPTAAGHSVIGKGCNGCHGTGWAMKYPSEFKPVGNHARISSINMEEVRLTTESKLNAFWNEWQDFCNGKTFPAFEGPRAQALAIGLVECKGMEELTGKEWRVQPWDKPDTPEDKRRNRCDVLKLTTKEWMTERFADAFSPLSTWARLDANGWMERGEMGWWGCGSDKPESVEKYTGGLRRWLTSGDQNDWIVIVDSHT